MSRTQDAMPSEEDDGEEGPAPLATPRATARKRRSLHKEVDHRPWEHFPGPT
ncbi:hypothetical protein [Sinomonas susongensis]|uniref:hypothetical protein n=1 Tax=Sinomonas susongensis TaxID=1324851 RepID=UPI0014875E7A|nr:hypothetical protein [Sinomonas susongensis]